MFVFILICLLISVCIYWKCKRISVEPSPPVYPGALPIIGHVYKLFGDSQYLYRLMCSLAEDSNRKGGVIVFKIGLDDYYIITDPDDFNTAANQCLKLHYTYDFIEPWLGTGLVSGTDVPVWKRHRKLISPAFRQQVVDGFMDIFNNAAKKMVEAMTVELGKGPFDVSCYLNRFSMDSICKTAFGVNTNDVEHFEIRSYMEAAHKIFHLITRRMQKFWLHSNILYSYSGLKKEVDDAANYLNGVSKSMLKLKKQSFSGNDSNKGTKFKAFMDLTLELADSGELTDKEVYEEMNTIIAAGYETSSSTLLFTLVLLGSHTNVQNKVYAELQSVFEDSPRDVEKNDLPKLVYLEAVLKESLRLFTITPMMLREVEKDVQLKNYIMPAGSKCLLFICGIHRHSVWGDDAEQFKPERWLENSDNHAQSKAFAGFGVGKRLCLGKSFAIVSMKTALVHMLRRYRVTSNISQMVLKVDPLLQPVTGQKIALELRTYLPTTTEQRD